MSVRHHCDLCGRPLEHDPVCSDLLAEGGAEVGVSARPFDLIKAEYHFCAPVRDDYDEPDETRQPTCVERVLELLDRELETKRADAGLECRLVSTGGES